MTKARKRLLIGLVVFGMVFPLALEVYRVIDDRAIAREADEARNLAIASASPATVPDDAHRWLESNGYRVIIWNPHDPRGFVGIQESSVDGKYVIVEGQRQIRRGDWLVKPRWLNLTFRFRLDGAFHDVQARPWPLEISAARPLHNHSLAADGGRDVGLAEFLVAQRGRY
jgi:hypothetical protein